MHAPVLHSSSTLGNAYLRICGAVDDSSLGWRRRKQKRKGCSGSRGWRVSFAGVLVLGLRLDTMVHGSSVASGRWGVSRSSCKKRLIERSRGGEVHRLSSLEPERSAILSYCRVHMETWRVRKERGRASCREKRARLRDPATCEEGRAGAPHKTHLHADGERRGRWSARARCKARSLGAGRLRA